jgi:diadenosine tetraphosphate (Ap4A) HIT family hydrolase
MSCIFCNIEKDRIILENEDAFAVNDVFPTI